MAKKPRAGGTAALKIWNGSSWDVIIAKVWNGTVWVDQARYWDGSAWIELYV